MKNGDGLRVVLWLSGCEHHCKNCQNPITHDPEDGLPFDKAAKQEIWDYLAKDYCSGITFSGGDPLFPGNREELLSYLRELKSKYPLLNIWCYTGYDWEEVGHLDHMQYIDVLVDGKYVDEERDEKLCWKGSKNQRVISVKESIKNLDLSPILWCTDYYEEK